jgi:hypothetical protein
MTFAPLITATEFPQLLRGEPASLTRWLDEQDSRRTLYCCAVITLGAGAYGAAEGIWRSDLQALYAAIKLPLIIFLTALGNALSYSGQGRLLSARGEEILPGPLGGLFEEQRGIRSPKAETRMISEKQNSKI